MMLMKVPLFIKFALCCVLPMLASCEQSPVTIEYIIPVGYRGPVTVTTKDPDGVELLPSRSHYEIRVSNNGVARTKGADPFRRWHTCIVKDENGVRVPNAGDVADKQIAFWSVESSSNTMHYFVGTKEEKEKHWNQTK